MNVKVEIVIETPEGMRLGRLEQEHESLMRAATKFRESLDRVGYVYIYTNNEITLLPSALVNQSVTRLRDMSADMDVPF